MICGERKWCSAACGCSGGATINYVSLRSQYGAGRTDGRRNPPQPGPRTRHDSPQTSRAGQIAGTQSDVRRVSEVFRRDAEAGERDSEAVGEVIVLSLT